jgi:hypothetical protein
MTKTVLTAISRTQSRKLVGVTYAITPPGTVQRRARSLKTPY